MAGAGGVKLGRINQVHDAAELQRFVGAVKNKLFDVSRLGDAAGFNDDTVGRRSAVGEIGQGFIQIAVAKLAADAATSKLHSAFGLLLHQKRIDVSFAKIIHNHANFAPISLAKQVIERRGFART